MKHLHKSGEEKPAASSPVRQKLIIASNNQGKIMEFRKLLEPFGFDVVSMREAGFTDEIVEDGDTFEENAHIKARAVFEATKLPTIADDSGLAGEGATDKELCEKVLEEMHGVSRPLREARFVCSIYFIYAEDDEYSVNGTVEGYIGDEMVGDKGFGYDPIFMVDEDHSMAELDQDEKNRISHRAKAFEELAKILKEKFS